jgi:hypothetical protein
MFNPNLESKNLKKENLNLNLGNPQKEIKSFSKTNHLRNLKKTLSVALKDGAWSFSNCN